MRDKEINELIIHIKCGLPIEFCVCKDAGAFYNWETGNIIIKKENAMKIRTNISIDSEVKKNATEKAKELGTSFSQVLERLVRNFLRKLK